MVKTKEFLLRLRKLREDQKRTQEDIASLFGKRDDPTFYGKKENGRHPLPVNELIVILDFLGVDIMDLFKAPHNQGLKHWDDIYYQAIDCDAINEIEAVVNAILETKRSKILGKPGSSVS